MNRFFSAVLFLPLLGILAGCGRAPAEKEGPGNAERPALFAEAEQIFDMDMEEECERLLGAGGGGKAYLLGMQFYGGEPAQLWGIWNKTAEGAAADIYLYRQGEAGELLLRGLPPDVCYQQGVADEKGGFYSVDRDTVYKYGADGELIYRSRRANCTLEDICLLSEETVALYAREDGAQKGSVVLMDAVTGELSEVMTSDALSWNSFLGAGENALFFLDGEGLWEIDRKEGTRGSVMSFLQTSFSLTSRLSVLGTKLRGFRVNGAGELQLLWSDAEGRGSLETLQCRAPEGQKTEIVIRGLYLYDSWLKDQIAEFNKRSDAYYVTVEVCGEDTEPEDFAAQTAVRLAAGKGPDIVYGDSLGESVYSLIQKGVFENVRPYMEASGIREEDYFKAAFDCFRQGEEVYGINTKVYAYGETVDGKLFPAGGASDREKLLDALLACEEKLIYKKNADAEAVVRSFLQGSESLWGTVDWDNHSCSFDNELFGKLLDVAKRYGCQGRSDFPAVAANRSCSDFYGYESDERLAREGRIVSGFRFDDGCHGVLSTSSILMLCADSRNKEGAWEFLRFLLSEETQVTVNSLMTFPVNKRAFETLAEKEIREGVTTVVYGADGSGYHRVKGDEALTEEKAEEIAAFLEDARPLPLRNEAILDIVCREAGDYFDDVKSREEVIRVIENRVGIYLKERQ